MDYKELQIQMDKLLNAYPFCEGFSIGQSWEGRELFGIRLGMGQKNCLYVGAHHALEYCTTDILMRFAFEFCEHLDKGTKIKGYNPKMIFEKSTLCIIPMLNPDGVELVINGLSKAHPLYDRVTKMNDGSNNFSEWQANIRGVDLNHNYNAGWLEGKMGERQLNIFFAGKTRYGGEYPESEKETAALCHFVRSIKPNMVMAFHSQGREIYYDYRGKLPPTAEGLAAIFSKLSGYTLSKPTGIAAVGGFKDWFIEEFNQPGFTIEAGEGKNPLTSEQTKHAYSELRELMSVAPLFI
jgi:g-D-glutamyl-meso-diaminopimelate peptidase